MTTYKINSGEDYIQLTGEEGPYTARVYRVDCVDELGNRWFHFKTFSDWEEAAELEQRIEDHIKHNADWTPGEHWHASHVVYGSIAYQTQGGESDLARVDVEAEYGAGSYTPSHPGYIG